MEPSMHFRETNMDPSMYFRKANTDPSMHFRKANTEFLLLVLLPTLFTISLSSLLLFPKITTNLLRNNEYNLICLSRNSKLSPLYSLCFIDIFLFFSKVASLQFPANRTSRKRPTLQNICTRWSPIQVTRVSVLFICPTSQ